MKIAIDISPITDESTSQHKVRGSGFYIRHLQHAFDTYEKQYQFSYIKKINTLPSNIDILHIPYFEPFFKTLPFKTQVKTVVTVHDLTPFVLPEKFPIGIKGRFQWQIQRYKLQHVAGVITDSQSSKNDIIRFAGVSPEKIHVISLAAGEEFREMQKNMVESVREKYHLPKEFILYVGDVTGNKNLPNLVQAVSGLGYPLVMVGSALQQEQFDKNNAWNADLVETRRIIEESKNIFVIGFVPNEDLVKMYNLANVFVMPSLYEGFGLPVLEAMMCGCPVITTKKGSLPEVAGDSAYYVDVDVESIAKGLSVVFQNEKVRKLLREKGKKQARKFSWAQTARKNIEVYESINKV